MIPQPIVFASDRIASLLKRVLPERTTFVKNRRELFGATFTRGAIAFVDYELLETIDGSHLDVPIVAVIDSPAPRTLAVTVEAFSRFPWLSNVVQAPLLAMNRGRQHCDALIDRLTSPKEELETLPTRVTGRSALLARASRRNARFDRMREYLTEQAVSERIISSLLIVAEELVMNALYNAPIEAGFMNARSRAEDVELPPDRACEISYGVDDATVFLRVRDSFGALKRNRLLEVLLRCSAEGVVLDESRGGAGLGMWTIFSAASAISVHVAPGAVTDITVTIGKSDSRRIPRPLSVDLYFADPRAARVDVGDDFLVDHSFTLTIAAPPTPTPTPQV